MPSKCKYCKDGKLPNGITCGLCDGKGNEIPPDEDLTVTTRWPTVAAYFKAVLRVELSDPQGVASTPDFTIDSVCGNDCARAIGAAGSLLHAAQLAGVEGDQIVRSTNHIVLVFIYG
jgi:hypothetical protein